MRPCPAPAATDDLSRHASTTGRWSRSAADVVEERSSTGCSRRIAGAIAERVLAAAPTADAVTVRVRKLAVPVDADLDYAQVRAPRRRR